MVLGELLISIGTDLSKLDKGLSDTVDRVERAGTRLRTVGMSLTAGVTVPLVAMDAGAIKASMDYETAMTNVAKTTDATDDVLAGLSREFTEMSERIPVSAAELANLASTAAQLGIKTKDVSAFTETMAMMGVATNLSAEDAATALAQLANVTGLAAEDFDNLGSAIVALGNKGASTESQITFMSQRIAAAGSAIGLSESAILGFAAALANTGVEVEMGGSAISRTFKEIDLAVAQGGNQLGLFARTAGMSVPAFSKLFKDDAQSALMAFFKGLSEVEGKGGNVTKVLSELGFTEIRQATAVGNLAAAYSRPDAGLAASIELSSRAFEESNALTKEAERFYATTTNQLKITRNEIVNTARELGDNLVPVLLNANRLFSGFVDVLGTLVRWFTALPGPVQGVVGVFFALLAAFGPVLVIAGQMAIAWVAFVPIAAGLGIGVGALIATFLLVPAALTAVVAAGVAIVDNWRIIKFEVMKLDAAIDSAFKKINAVLYNVAHPVEFATNKFREMWDKVVGHSYVPDMLKGIANEFKKLDAAMVRPSSRAIDDVVNAFRMGVGKLSAQQQLLVEVMSRQESAGQRLKDLRLDLMFAKDADTAIALRSQIAEVTAEFTRLGGMVKALEPVRAEMERIVETIDKMDAGLDRSIKKFNEMSEKTGGGFTTTPITTTPIVTTPPAIPSEIAGLLGIVTEWGEALGLSIPTIAWLATAAEDAGGFLLSAGKSFLSHVGNLFGSIFSIFNPLAIITQVLNGAFQKIGAELNGPFMESIGEIVAILIEALKPVLDALVPVFQAIVPIISELAPVISAVAQILGVLFKAIMPIIGAMIPLLRVLFPVFKFLAIVATYLGQIFSKAAQIVAKIISAFAQVVGNVVVVIGKALDALPFVNGKPIINFGKGLLKASDEMDNMAAGFGQAFTELGDAREEIKGITLEEPMKAAADNLTGVSDAAGAAADTLWGVAGGRVPEPVAFADPPRAGQIVPDVHTTGTSETGTTITIDMTGSQIVTSGDGEDTYQNFRETLVRKSFKRCPADS